MQLLDRLEQVDPTTYEKIVSGMPIYPRSIYYVFDPGAKKPRAEMYKDGWIRFADLPKEAACAWLQACLQTAIRSRGGWYWKISSQQLDSTGKYVCEIVKESGWKTVWVREEGNSPTEAMLAAYIEAMA